MKDRLVVHVPYQVNTMSLFEMLNVGVIFLLPSIELFIKWRDEGRLAESYRVVKRDLSCDEIRTLVDWYRHDLAHLFFYFDHVEDLLPGSEFMKKVLEGSQEKRAMIREYMDKHQETTIKVWEDTLTGPGILTSST